jgi:hypothetical protein
MIWAALTLGFVLSTAACATASSATEVDYGIRGVILSAGRLQDTFAFSGAAEERYAPYWTPSRGDVEDLTRQLLAFLQTSDHSIDNEILANLHEYLGQYYGYTIDERQVLELTAFCPSEIEDLHPTFDWKRELFWITHGGRCYFLAEYDPTIRELIYYYVSPYPERGPITLFGAIPPRYPAPQGSSLFDSAEHTISTMSRWSSELKTAMEYAPEFASTHGPFLGRRELHEYVMFASAVTVDGWNNELLFWVKGGHYAIVSLGSDGEPDQPYRTMDNLPSEIEGRGEIHESRHDIVLTDGAFVSPRSRSRRGW